MTMKVAAVRRPAVGAGRQVAVVTQAAAAVSWMGAVAAKARTTLLGPRSPAASLRSPKATAPAPVPTRSFPNQRAAAPASGPAKAADVAQPRRKLPFKLPLELPLKLPLTLPLLSSKRAGASTVYSWCPSSPVEITEVPKGRWPSRLAAAGLVVAIGLGAAGASMAYTGKSAPMPGHSAGYYEDVYVAARVRFEKANAMVFYGAPDWAGYLPPEALQWIPVIQESALREGIDPRLLASVVWVESRFNPVAISPKGAIGLAQVMPLTARELGINVHDPIQNLAGGARYLRINLDRFRRADLALAAYNAGPTRVGEARTMSRLPEIKAYVTQVLETYEELGGGV